MDKELAKRLGLNPDEIYPISEKQRLFNSLAGAEVINENGEDYDTLVTITAQDIKKWGVQGKPQKGKIALEELIEKGSYQVSSIS